MLTALIGPIATLAGTWFENKVEKTKAEGQAKVAEARARATVAEKVAAGEVAWEGKMADATVDSWKDEFALVVLLAPAILVFIPGMRDYVKEGFEILATLPDWYQYLLYSNFCIVWYQRCRSSSKNVEKRKVTWQRKRKVALNQKIHHCTLE